MRLVDQADAPDVVLGAPALRAALSSLRYESTFTWLRSWSCMTCQTILCGREHQCPHCLTPRNPLPFA